MKKLSLLAAFVAGLVITGCSHDDPETSFVVNPSNPDYEDTITISFSRAFNYSIEPFQSRTRAGLSDVATHLDVWIIQGDDVTEVHQLSDDADFGIVSLKVNRQKEYTMKAVAHKCSAAATMTDGVVSFPEGELKHTLYACHTFKPDTISAELPVNMQRIVGSFKLITTDSIPSRVYTMRFCIKNSPQQFNTADMTGIAKADRTVEFSNFARKADGTNTFTIYVMPETMTAQHGYDIEVTGLKQNGDVVESRTFPSVQIRAGYRSQYQGAFFVTRSAGFAFCFDDWNDLPTVDF